MVDPIDGVLGALVLTGWIGETPEGRDSPYLMFTTPDDRAPHTMPIVATALGMDPRPGKMTPTPKHARVTLDGDRWITVHAEGGVTWPYRVSDEWERLARTQKRVVVAVAYRPMKAGVDPFTFVDESMAEDPTSMVLTLAPAKDKE